LGDGRARARRGGAAHEPGDDRVALGERLAQPRRLIARLLIDALAGLRIARPANRRVHRQREGDARDRQRRQDLRVVLAHVTLTSSCRLEYYAAAWSDRTSAWSAVRAIAISSSKLGRRLLEGRVPIVV